MRVPESAGGTCDVDAHQEPAIPALHLQHLDRGADAVERDPELAEDPGPVAPQRQRATGGPQMSGALTLWSNGTRILRDRKSTRLNSSHAHISYAGFCF